MRRAPAVPLPLAVVTPCWTAFAASAASRHCLPDLRVLVKPLEQQRVVRKWEWDEGRHLLGGFSRSASDEAENPASHHRRRRSVARTALHGAASLAGGSGKARRTAGRFRLKSSPCCSAARATPPRLPSCRCAARRAGRRRGCGPRRGRGLMSIVEVRVKDDAPAVLAVARPAPHMYLLVQQRKAQRAGQQRRKVGELLLQHLLRRRRRDAWLARARTVSSGSFVVVISVRGGGLLMPPWPELLKAEAAASGLEPAGGCSAAPLAVESAARRHRRCATARCAALPHAPQHRRANSPKIGSGFD